MPVLTETLTVTGPRINASRVTFNEGSLVDFDEIREQVTTIFIVYKFKSFRWSKWMKMATN